MALIFVQENYSEMKKWCRSFLPPIAFTLPALSQTFPPCLSWVHQESAAAITTSSLIPSPASNRVRPLCIFITMVLIFYLNTILLLKIYTWVLESEVGIKEQGLPCRRVRRRNIQQDADPQLRAQQCSAGGRWMESSDIQRRRAPAIYWERS